MLKEILRTRLRLGELGEEMEKGRPRATFGTADTIQQLKNGQLVF
jgi:hypothetical protein